MPTPAATVRKSSSPRSSANGSRRAGKETPASASIGARINASLAESDLTQSDLARLLAGPLAEPTRVASVRRLIAKWRRDEHMPNVDYALHLAEIFQKPRSYFAPEGAAEIDVTERGSRSSAEIDAIEFIRQAAAQFNQANARTVSLPRTKGDIAKLVPQFNRDYILIDRVTELVPGERVVAEKTFTEDDWDIGPWYQGTDIIPAVLLVEALAQAGALVLLTEPQNHGRIALSAGFNNVRFRRVVKSKDKLELQCSITAVHGPIAHARVVAKVGADVAVRGELVLAVH